MNPQIWNPDLDIIYFNINFLKLLNINRKKKRNPSRLNLSLFIPLSNLNLGHSFLSLTLTLFNFSSQSLICSVVPLSISLTRFSLNLSHSLFNSLVISFLQIRSFAAWLSSPSRCAYVCFNTHQHQHHASHLSFCRGQQKGVDFAVVFCGLWGWISRLLYLF